MATIVERKQKNGSLSFRVSIRRKNVEICRTFEDLQTAELYAWYKEKLINEMDAFEVPRKDLLTLRDVLMMKQESVKEDVLDGRRDFIRALDFLSSFFNLDIEINKITYESLVAAGDFFVTQKVIRGGDHKTGKGKLNTISPVTIRRHLANLSSAINYVRSLGFDVANPLLDYMPYFRLKYLSNGKEIE